VTEVPLTPDKVPDADTGCTNDGAKIVPEPEGNVVVTYPTTLEVTESWAKSAELASKALATRSEVFFISSLIEGLSIRK
jgi:hypothetical protein